MAIPANQQAERPSIEQIIHAFLDKRNFPQRISRFGALRLVLVVKKELEERIPESSRNAYNPHKIVRTIIGSEHYHPTPDGGYEKDRAGYR